MLANFKYSIKYRLGNVHENADFLSRIPIQSVKAASRAEDTMIREQKKDPVCSDIRDYLENGTLSEENSTRIWAKEIDLYSISKGPAKFAGHPKRTNNQEEATFCLNTSNSPS